MKNIILSLIGCWSLLALQAQNVGIGTGSPVEKLDVNGGIKIGASSNANPGTIRWNAVKNDFEGYNGTAWVSLTGGKGQWGNQESFMTENEASQNYLRPSGSDRGDYLGESIAMHNGLVVAGARGDYNSTGDHTYSGNAYLYAKTAGSWEMKRVISNPTPASGENFGAAAGIHNNRVIIGAPSVRFNDETKGEAYIFLYDPAANTHTQEATLAAYDGQEYDYYGESVGICGDYAVVGAPLRDASGVLNCGAVYVYKRTGNQWTQTGFISPADRGTEDRFGYKVSLSGEWLAVSAHKSAVNGMTEAGKVYIYQLNSAGTTYNYHSTVTAPDPAAYEEFGTAIHLTGDTLAVGAPQYRNIATAGNGRVLLFTRSGNAWQHQHTLTASDGKKSDAFGYSVSLNGSRLIAGANRAKVGSNVMQGKAYVFFNNGTAWEEEAVFTNSDGTSGSAFGWDVATDGNDAVISANNHTWMGNIQHGRIYFFRR